jgi:hypothetical protein
MNTAIRLLIIGALAAIIASLGSALYYLTRSSTADPRRFARALTIRIGLSVALFILLMIAWYFGLITPHGLSPTGATPH